MAGKVLRTIAGRLADDAAEAARATRNAQDALSEIPPPALIPIQDLEDYDKIQQSLRQQGKIDITPDDIQMEVNRKLADIEEQDRVDGITDTGAMHTINNQSRTPEEFAGRMEQLRDPEFSARGVTGLTETDELSEIRKRIDAGHAGQGEENFVNRVDNLTSSQKEHQANVATILSDLEPNARWKSATDEWFDGSPYQGDIQFHTDRFTDPTRPNSFIQFEEPWEIGLHSGTNRAAESVIARGGMDELARNMETQAQAVEQVAQQLDMPVREVQGIMARAAQRHFVRKFSENGDVNIWDETEALLERFVESFGADRGQVHQFIAGIKSMPRPSTTPFLFRGKNGLLLEDEGGFKAGSVARQLTSIFNNQDDIRAIDIAMSGGNEVERTRGLHQFMESKGYDHIVYHNSVEDKGSLSIINWNPDLMASPWDRRFARSPQQQAQIASQYVLGALGLNAAVRDEE